MTFLIWDIGRFYGLDKSYYYVDGCHIYTDDYEKIWSRMDNNIKLDKKFIDIGQDYNKILKVFDIIISDIEELDKERINVLWKKFEQLKIHYEVCLWENEEGEEIKYIQHELNKMIIQWREEWELAWKEGRRNYGI